MSSSVKEFIIQVSDPETADSSEIILTRQDILAIRKEAADYPVSPLLVKRIEEASRQEGFLLTEGQESLYRIAKEIIVEGGRYFSLTGQRFDPAAFPARHRSGVVPSLQKSRHHLFCCKYRDPLQDLEKLKAKIEREGRIPVLWSSTGGLSARHLSRQFPMFEKINPQNLKDPRKALGFVIDNSLSRAGYIFEDIHHYIGDREGIGPAIGEIRSLIKELYRALAGREDRVYLFVPDSYEMPADIRVFLEDSEPAGRRRRSSLDRYGCRMTAGEYVKKIKPVIGAEQLIERIIQTLSQMEGNNPLLVGHPGVGKTSVVEGFGVALAEGRVPANLRGRELYSLSLSSLIAGTRYRGELEERLEKMMSDVLQHRDEIILFIDEIQGLLDAGMAEGGFGIGDILKPVLARGEFPLIGATTTVGAGHLMKDPALMRRFRTIVVDEPSPDETLQILRGIRASLEQHHGVRIDDSALFAAVRLSERVSPEAFRPGKVIVLVDSAAAYCRMKSVSVVREIDILREVNRK